MGLRVRLTQGLASAAPERNSGKDRYQVRQRPQQGPCACLLPPKPTAPMESFRLGKKLRLALRTQHPVGLEHDSDNGAPRLISSRLAPLRR